MTKLIKAQIIDAEERFGQAMLASDVGVFNELLDPKLLPVILGNY